MTLLSYQTPVISAQDEGNIVDRMCDDVLALIWLKLDAETLKRIALTSKYTANEMRYIYEIFVWRSTVAVLEWKCVWRDTGTEIPSHLWLSKYKGLYWNLDNMYWNPDFQEEAKKHLKIQNSDAPDKYYMTSGGTNVLPSYLEHTKLPTSRYTNGKGKVFIDELNVDNHYSLQDWLRDEEFMVTTPKK